jgi:hypothetical protein
MTFFGDHEGALWAIATGTSGGEDCENAEIMRGIAQEALGTAWTDYLNHQKGTKEAFGQVIPFSSEQPQTPDPQSSEGESYYTPESTEPLSQASFEPGGIMSTANTVEVYRSNGTTHPEQQD